MRYIKHYRTTTWLSLLALLIALCTVLLPAGNNRAQATSIYKKLAPDLRRMTGSRRNDNARVNVIVQFNRSPDEEIESLLKGNGTRSLRQFRNFNSRLVSLPVHAVEALAAHDAVRYISVDRQTGTYGHITSTTGTDAIRTQVKTTTTTLFGIVTATMTTTTTLDGAGLSIAIIDSGIERTHKSFLDANGLSRVIVDQDFTGEGRTDDPFGHGTHVASAAAGNGQFSQGSYTGIAPGAKLVNLRVLDSEGTGNISSLLGALDWVMTNRTLYNIRVVNMSLGTPAIDSYLDDPVCLAVRRLVDAGVVVLAAAGNNGKDSAGQKVYGRIHSPGDEPSAITVGATNTFGTDERGDDAITTYSSRGPTRGYRTDDGGVRHYDNLFKPDLVAPGNKVIWAEAPGNNIVTAHPELDAGVGASANEKMMYLSGTSMATPVAAGAAALLLQANPSLTPNLIKAILMYTAQPLAGFNMFEQGAGQINIEGAVRLARL
ncbi:MAG TPA: S8 family serine peptidase, partial [Pyrinomonadaceae bacterium]